MNSQLVPMLISMGSGHRPQMQNGVMMAHSEANCAVSIVLCHGLRA